MSNNSDLYNSIPHGRREVQPSRYDPSFASSDYDVNPSSDQAKETLSTLPSFAYRPPSTTSPQRSSGSTTFEQYASNASVNGFTSEAPRPNRSPDPHDFYRQYRDSFRREGFDDLQADGKTTKGGEGMTTIRSASRPKPANSHRSNGLPPLPGRLQSHFESRVSPSPTTSPNGKSNKPLQKLTAHLPTSSRKTSLQALVNKFERTTDEIPPVPNKPNSRSSSATRATSTTHASKLLQARNLGDTTIGHGSIPQSLLQSRGESFHARTTPRSTASSKLTLASAIRVARPRLMHSMSNTAEDASRSMVNLNREKAPNGPQPLFGEVLAVDTESDAGFGIPSFRPRRGSEGSMHAPNPMFPVSPQSLNQNSSSTSPDGWYRGTIPTLEGIDLNKPVPPRPLQVSVHRRSRSDITSVLAKPHPSSLLASHMTIMSPPLEERSVFPSPNPAQSRIPVRTRRQSCTSDSGGSAASTRNNSIGHGQSPRKAPGRTIAARSIPLETSFSVPEDASTPTTPKSSPRRNFSPSRQNPRKSPRLQAYISESAPMKSPPLRSSRPRKPVSSASTAASRARAAERPNETNASADPKDRGIAKAPEGGNVDFAARRQQIQRAFTKTIKANQKIEFDKKSASRAEAALVTETLRRAQSDYRIRAGDAASSSNGAVSDSRSIHAHAMSNGLVKHPKETLSHTFHAPSRFESHSRDADSPTLGVANPFPAALEGKHSRASFPPEDGSSSVVTTSTMETVMSLEVQEESSPPTVEPKTPAIHFTSNQLADDTHPTLSSVRQSILARPASAMSYGSERGDEESIHIMLGDSPSLDRHKRSLASHSSDLRNSIDPWNPEPWTTVMPESSLTEQRTSTSSGHHDGQAKDELAKDEIGHTSLSTTASLQTSFNKSGISLPSTRTTIDSDAYNTVNHLFDSYHDPHTLSSEAISDFQQRIFAQTPNFAREGGWDPKKVTQLYLQSLGRARYSRSVAVPEPLSASVSASHTDLRILPAEVYFGNAAPETTQQHYDTQSESSLTDSVDSEAPQKSPNLMVSDLPNPQRASLTHPDDWANTSPSMLDWMNQQAEDVKVSSAERPLPFANDWSNSSGERRTPKPQAESSLHLPEIQATHGGLGIDINVQSPVEAVPPSSASPFSHIVSRSRSRSPQFISAPSRYSPSPQRVPSPSTSPGIFHRSQFSVNTALLLGPTPPTKGSNDEASQTSHRSDPSLDPRTSTEERTSTAATSTAEPAPVNTGPPTAEQKRLTRRKHIIKELVDTESSFGQDMTVVDDIYKGTCSMIITSPEDVKTLFGNSIQIVAFSTTFLDALKQAAKQVYVLPKSKRWRKRDSVATSGSSNSEDQPNSSGSNLSDADKDRTTSIGLAFGEHMGQMEKVYTDYLKNHDAANRLLSTLQEDENVKIWLKECRSYAHDLTTAWDLDSLLVKPVQRITKYPLLLKELLDATPENHPDWNTIEMAYREMVGLTMRINEVKRRTDLLEQVSGAISKDKPKKKKESDGILGFPKAFGRNKEKVKINAGVVESFYDKKYDELAEKMGPHYFQLQVVMRDVDMYTRDADTFVTHFNNFVLAIEEYMDVAQTIHPEIESKWRRFRLSVREMQMTALADHKDAVRKHVIEPMTVLLKLHDSPLRLIKRREKRVPEFARFKALKDRGEKMDKKTAQQGEEFLAVNAALKDELPKLFTLTGKLVGECLNVFVQLQLQWQSIWKKKLSQAIDQNHLPLEGTRIIEAFNSDFHYPEAQVLSLGICNGSLLADTANLVTFLSPSTTLNGDESSSRRPSTQTEDSRRRGISASSDVSPMLPQPEFSRGHLVPDILVPQYNFSTNPGQYMTAGPPASVGRRVRATSSASGRSPKTPDVSPAWHTVPTIPSASLSNRPATSTGRSYESSAPGNYRHSQDGQTSTRAPTSMPYFSSPRDPPQPAARPSSPTTTRYSGVFSSALPMSDSPLETTPTEDQQLREYSVLFLAASVYEFNIDRSRREAGYPYLTYGAGEIFDIIAEKGELWLAKNQDDSRNQLGWIWNKHFAKLAV